MKCKMVPASKEAWEGYALFARQLGVEAPRRADAWIFFTIETVNSYLAAGAQLHFGPDSIALEGFHAHPTLRRRELYAIAWLTVSTARAFATLHGKQLRARAPTRGIARLLERHGFQPAGPALPGIWFVQPGLGPFDAPLPRRAPRSTGTPVPPVAPKRKVAAAAVPRKRRK